MELSTTVRWTKSNNWILFLVASLHLAAALSHFLLSVVSKYVARDIHYGNQACSTKAGTSGTLTICSVAKTNQTCANIFGEGTQEVCEWNYTGLGLEYQLLAGPSFIAVYTITSIFWGMAADRYNRFNLLSLCSIIFSVAMVLTAFATRFWHLVLLRMVLAIGVGGISPIVPGILFDSFPEKHRALALGFFHWGIYLGGGLSNTIGNLNIFEEGWRGAFLVSGIPGIFLTVLMLLTGKDPPRKHKGEEGDFHSHTHHGHTISVCPTVPTKRIRKLYVHHEENFDKEEEEEEEDVIEYEINEAQVLLDTERQDSRDIPFSLWQCCFQPSVLLLGIGSCIRQAAGYTWGYNSALYYQTYYPGFDASGWLTWITIFGGSIGVIFGGFLSDRLVSRLGLSGRALVLAVSQLISFPFCLGTLWFDPPMSFFSLLVGYFFAEMWYGVVFAILVELLPSSIRSLGIAVAFFIINNFGGNVPVFVSPLSQVFSSYRTALTMLYPGSVLISSFFFFMAFISLSKK